MTRAKITIDAEAQGRRLREARIRRGFASGKKACEFFGWNYNTYAQHESGRSPLNLRNAPPYAIAYGVSVGWLLSGGTEALQVPMIPVSGKVSAGTWLETDYFGEPHEDAEKVPADPQYPSDHQFVVEVDGPSINRVAKDGDKLVCLSVVRAAVRLADRDLVIVRRSRFSGQLLEFTAKRLRIPPGEAPWELWPDSTDDSHQARIVLDGEGMDEFDGVEIIGKVQWILRKP